MDRWFTVEEIDVQTYAISEYQHWEQSHCYLLCGQQRAALIDTGLGVSDIRRVVNGLTKLPVTVLTTHAHWDHIGGHQYFNDIAIHEEEKDWLSVRFPLPLQEVKNQLMKKPCGFPESFDPNRYRIFRGETQRVLHDNDRLDLGGRTHIQSFFLNNIDVRMQKIIVTVALVVATIILVLITVDKVISSIGTVMTMIPKVVSLMGTINTAMASSNATMATNPIGLIMTVDRYQNNN